MTASNFLNCFVETEGFEGGFVNNPHDPGGTTMAGVTQATYSAWRKAMHLPPAPVKDCTIEERQDIYRAYFWNPVHGDVLFDGLDLVMVDTAWGSGLHEAVKLLQRCAHVGADGDLGPATLAAVAKANQPELINALCAARMAFFQSLNTWKYFGEGWTKRLNGVHAKALAMNAAAPKKPGASETFGRTPSLWQGLSAFLKVHLFAPG